MAGCGQDTAAPNSNEKEAAPAESSGEGLSQDNVNEVMEQETDSEPEIESEPEPWEVTTEMVQETTGDDVKIFTELPEDEYAQAEAEAIAAAKEELGPNEPKVADNCEEVLSKEECDSYVEYTEGEGGEAEYMHAVYSEALGQLLTDDFLYQENLEGERFDLTQSNSLEEAYDKYTIIMSDLHTDYITYASFDETTWETSADGNYIYMESWVDMSFGEDSMQPDESYYITILYDSETFATLDTQNSLYDEFIDPVQEGNSDLLRYMQLVESSGDQ